MRTNANTETIEGRIYQHNLVMKKVENQASKNYGKEFISGTIDVAVDDACREILQVHYTFVTETTKTGAANVSFTNLKRIMDSGKTIMVDGPELATKVRLTPSAALNDFYPQGSSELVSTPRHEGGFVTIINELNPNEALRHRFEFDTLMLSCKRVEANPEKGIESDYLTINCAIFNFKNDILPFTLVAKTKGAIDYFESLGFTPSAPFYTHVWGTIENTTVASERRIPTAFGDDVVEMSERRVREWVITRAAKEPFEFGDPDVMTVADVQKALENRNLALADIKKRSDEYYASKNGASTPFSGIPEGGFKF